MLEKKKKESRSRGTCPKRKNGDVSRLIFGANIRKRAKDMYRNEKNAQRSARAWSARGKNGLRRQRKRERSVEGPTPKMEPGIQNALLLDRGENSACERDVKADLSSRWMEIVEKKAARKTEKRRRDAMNRAGLR